MDLSHQYGFFGSQSQMTRVMIETSPDAIFERLDKDSRGLEE